MKKKLTVEEQLEAHSALLKKNNQMIRALHRRQRLSDFIRTVTLFIFIGGGYWVWTGFIQPIYREVNEKIEFVGELGGKIEGRVGDVRGLLDLQR